MAELFRLARSAGLVVKLAGGIRASLAKPGLDMNEERMFVTTSISPDAVLARHPARTPGCPHTARAVVPRFAKQPSARETCFALLALMLFTGWHAAQAQEPGTVSGRPNLVIILADDMGYSDPGSYGGEIATPHIDRLAEHGLRFSQFYNTARCVPTRASLLTGVYSHQAGLGGMTFDWGTPGYRGYLAEHTPTIAELLGAAGYQTGMVGKWHLALTEPHPPEVQLRWLAHQSDLGPFAPLAQYPTARGFHDFYGTIWGVVDYFDPFSLVYGTEPVERVPVDFYYTAALSDTASAFIERYSNSDAPFFLYVAYTSPHWPLQAPPEAIAKYEQVYSIGWDAIRQARYDRMTALGLVPENALSPRIEPQTNWASYADSAWDARALAVHAAMVDRMDQGIGRILETLERTGELDNTLIFFLSDNGASAERPSEYGPGFDRAGSTRDHRAVYFPVEKTQMPGPQTVHAGIGPLAANTVNTPFRWWKAKVHEGGIATPLIAHWPAGLGTEAGSITDQPGHVIDLAATALDLAGVAFPETFAGQPAVPLEGLSLLPILRGERRIPHETLFWEHEGAGAVRRGTLKLVRVSPEAPWELYDLSTDRTERNDLAAQHPDMVAELDSVWNAWAERVHVFPKREPE